MPQKKITDLQLKASVLGDESLPVDNGIQSYRVTPSQMYDYVRSRIPDEAYEIGNLTIVPSVGSNALTIALKTKAGTNPTSTDPIRLGFRNSSLTSGSFNLRQVTGALSIVVSSGSTLGQVSGQASRIWVYAIDNAGTVELAVSSQRYRDHDLVTTTAEGGAGAADSHSVIYSTTARTSVPVRVIGYIDNTQSTAGTWASTGTQLEVWGLNKIKPPTLQIFSSGSGTYYTPAGCTAIRVRLIGGGGGGSGSGTSGGNGTTGGDTTFGSITGSAGVGAVDNGAQTGGAATGGDINLRGGGGQGRPTNNASSFGGVGGNGAFGGGGSGGNNGASIGWPGGTNTGGGGGGAGASATASAGTGGGSGGYCEKLISNPIASYSYGVGAGGAAGGAGTGGAAGGAGGSGIIIVEEFYD